MPQKSIFSQQFFVFSKYSVCIDSHVYSSQSVLIYAKRAVNAQLSPSIPPSLLSPGNSFCPVYLEHSRRINSAITLHLSLTVISIFLLMVNQPTASLMRSVEVYFLRGPSLLDNLHVNVRVLDKLFFFITAHNLPESYTGSCISRI